MQPVHTRITKTSSKLCSCGAPTLNFGIKNVNKFSIWMDLENSQVQIVFCLNIQHIKCIILCCSNQFPEDRLPGEGNVFYFMVRRLKETVELPVQILRIYNCKTKDA